MTKKTCGLPKVAVSSTREFAFVVPACTLRSVRLQCCPLSSMLPSTTSPASTCPGELCHQ